MHKDGGLGVAVQIMLEQQKEMRDEQRIMQKDITDIKEQTTKTNGRVTALEGVNKRANEQKDTQERNLKWWMEYALKLLPWIIACISLVVAYFK